MPKTRIKKRAKQKNNAKFDAQIERYRAKTLRKYGSSGVAPSKEQIDADVKKHAETQKSLRTASRAGAVSTSLRNREDKQAESGVVTNNYYSNSSMDQWNGLINQEGTGGTSQSLDTGSDQIDRG